MVSDVDVVLATGQVMPREDTETPLLVASLQARGLLAAVVPWQHDLDWVEVPLVVVRTPWDYFAQRDEFLGWASRIDLSTRLVNPASVLEWNSHKGYLLRLAEAGVPTLPTSLLVRGSSAADQRAALARYREVVIKPAVSVGAIGALRALGQSHAAASHLAELTGQGDVLVQPFEPAVLTEGEISLIYFGGEYSHAVRKVPATGDYRVQQRHGGALVDHEPTAAQREVAAAALAQSPAPTTYARVDLVRFDAPAVMELEIIEPELFLRRDPRAADRFADEIERLIRSG